VPAADCYADKSYKYADCSVHLKISGRFILAPHFAKIAQKVKINVFDSDAGFEFSNMANLKSKI